MINLTPPLPHDSTFFSANALPSYRAKTVNIANDVFERVIIYAPGVWRGGGLILLHELATALRPNHDILIHDSRTTLEHGPILQTVANRPIERLRAEYSLYRQSRPTDLIICFANLPPFFPVSSHVAIYFHNALILKDKRLKYRLLRYLFMTKLQPRHNVFCQTQTIVKRLHLDLGVTAHQLVFLPGNQKTPQHVAFSVKKPTDPFIFFYPSSTAPHKNHTRLLKAWQRVFPKLPCTIKLRLTIPPDDPLLHDYDLKALGIEALGWINKDEIKTEYRNCDAMIFPSLEETIGLPILEAHRAGKPVLASNLPFATTFVEPAILFDPLNSNTIEAAIYNATLGKGRKINAQGNTKMTNILDGYAALKKILEICGTCNNKYNYC